MQRTSQIISLAGRDHSPAPVHDTQPSDDARSAQLSAAIEHLARAAEALASAQRHLAICGSHFELREGGATTSVYPADALVLSTSGRWFRPPQAPRVSLERRHVLRRIVRALGACRQENPGAGLSRHDLVQVAWPDERLNNDVGADRLYVAIVTLRRLGLRHVLRHQRRSYLFDPGTPAVLVNDSFEDGPV